MVLMFSRLNKPELIILIKKLFPDLKILGNPIGRDLETMTKQELHILVETSGVEVPYVQKMLKEMDTATPNPSELLSPKVTEVVVVDYLVLLNLKRNGTVYKKGDILNEGMSPAIEKLLKDGVITNDTKKYEL